MNYFKSTFFTLGLSVFTGLSAQAQLLPDAKPAPAEKEAKPAPAPVKVDPSKLDGEDFVDHVRDSMISTSWIKLSGNINFRPKKGQGKRMRVPLTFAAEMRPKLLIFQSTLNGKKAGAKEVVKVQQTYSDIHESKELDNIKPAGQAQSTFDKLGIRPTDLSLSFMYWDMIKEYDKQSLGIASIKCRVFLMANPDSNEHAKVWISEKYLGPIRVEWYGKDMTKASHKILTFEEFTEKNKVWVPTDIYINNLKGELQIKFKKEDINAAFGPKSPKDLYK